MKKTSKMLPLISGLLIIGLTVLLYALLVDNLFSSIVKWLSLIFVVIAEIAMLLKVLIGSKDHIMNIQNYVGITYWLITLILSWVFIAIPSPNIKIFIAFQVTFLVIIVVLDLVILYFSNRATVSDSVLATTQAVIGDCVAIAEEIVALNANNVWVSDLKAIHELLLYADNTFLSGNEEQIVKQLLDLKEILKKGEIDEPSTTARINDIKQLIYVRTRYGKQNKKGNF